MGLSEDYINMKSKLNQNFNNLVLFLFFFPFLLNLYPITKSINQMLHVLPFLFSKPVFYSVVSLAVYLKKFSEAEPLVMKNTLLLEIPSKGKNTRKFCLIILFCSSYQVQ